MEPEAKKPYLWQLVARPARSQGRLLVYRWRGRPIFLRLSLAREGLPPCPRLYDEVMEIPVVNRGDPAPAARTRSVPLVADWLEDLLEEE